MGDSPPLIMRPSPLLGTYIGQCQNGAVPAPGDLGTGNAAAPATPAASTTGIAPANATGGN
jgi:hypothetical protein